MLTSSLEGRHTASPRASCKHLKALRPVWLWDTSVDIMQRVRVEKAMDVQLLGPDVYERELLQLAQSMGVSAQDIEQLKRKIDVGPILRAVKGVS